jgi:hypothetical protein
VVLKQNRCENINIDTRLMIDQNFCQYLFVCQNSVPRKMFKLLYADEEDLHSWTLLHGGGSHWTTAPRLFTSPLYNAPPCAGSQTWSKVTKKRRSRGAQHGKILLSVEQKQFTQCGARRAAPIGENTRTNHATPSIHLQETCNAASDPPFTCLSFFLSFLTSPPPTPSLSPVSVFSIFLLGSFSSFSFPAPLYPHTPSNARPLSPCDS